MCCEKNFRANTIIIIAISKSYVYARMGECHCETISQRPTDAEIMGKTPKNPPYFPKTLLINAREVAAQHAQKFEERKNKKMAKWFKMLDEVRSILLQASRRPP